MKRIAKQNGIALLAFALLLVVGLSTILVNKLETNTTFYERQNQNTEVLIQAKQALLGYIINYPEINAGVGPGFLPCPDRDGDGDTDAGACSEGGNTNIGLLPYETLEASELLDASGGRLWYVLSNNFRNNPQLSPFNSETVENAGGGTLTVDSNSDIAAIIIAAGEPVDSQNRNISISVANKANTLVNEYLEDDNFDLDNSFVSESGGEFNDRMIYITRQEIMQLVEKRVLAEAANTMSNYFNNPDQDENTSGNEIFPWLSSFTDPDVSNFKSSLNTVEGHIPYHYSADTNPNSNPFLTELNLIWSNITNGTINITGTTVREDCLRNLNCADTDGINDPITDIGQISSNPTVNCTWVDKLTVNCEEISFSRDYPYRFSLDCPIGSMTRTYTVNFPSFNVTDENDVNLTLPTTSELRRRSVNFSGSINDAADVIQIRDVYNGQKHNGLVCENLIDSEQGFGALTLDDSSANIIASNIRYDLDADTKEEIPSWLIEDEWIKQIYVVYANDDVLGQCDPATNCITLETFSCSSLAVCNTFSTTNNNNAIVLLAGREIIGQIRPSNNISDYFEQENNNGDQLFENARKNTAFNTMSINDQIVVIGTN